MSWEAPSPCGRGSSPVDLPDYDLKSGDIGTVVLVHQEGLGYEVEFMTIAGETIAIVSLLSSQVRGIGDREIAQARGLASS